LHPCIQKRRGGTAGWIDSMFDSRLATLTRDEEESAGNINEELERYLRDDNKRRGLKGENAKCFKTFKI